MSTITLTKDNFSTEVMDSEKTVLIDFWANWCGPCKMLSPIIDEIANDKIEGVKVAKVNVDDQMELAAQFGVRSIPTVVVMKDGKIKALSVGVKPKKAILDLLKE